ncbi:uncharacterized protein A4U43_C07F27350, partial [Asparagus officinalis]
LFSWLNLVRGLHLKFKEVLKAERATREEAEKDAAPKEAELVAWRRSDVKWRQEMETREEMLMGLKAHNSEKSTPIKKLKEDMGHLQREIYERDN